MSQLTQARTEVEAALISRAQTEPAFRQALLANAKATVEKELGVHFPAGMQLKVLEETATTRYLVLPTDPNGELSDAELESVAGGVGKWSSGGGGGGGAGFGVQKDKMTSANKNAEATRALL